MAQARIIFKADPDATIGVITKKFHEDIGMTEAMARTYFYLVCKENNRPTPREDARPQTDLDKLKRSEPSQPSLREQMMQRLQLTDTISLDDVEWQYITLMRTEDNSERVIELDQALKYFRTWFAMIEFTEQKANR
jgi:hypothetical protein